MSVFAPTKNLIRVSTAKVQEIKNWKEAHYLLESSRRTVDELIRRAAIDRYKFARRFLAVADGLVKQERPQNRVAVGRYYYAMYHAMRAAVFLHHQGDDYEAHSQLPTRAPPDLVDGAALANSLKSARERRNRADYDPYPKSDAAWESFALELRQEAHALSDAIGDYLRLKGCAV